jgi:hypothetical protein
MKTNGISFFEQHVEKLVLGLSGAVFLSVVVWQLFPSSVSLGSETVSYGEIDKRLTERAAVLKGKLEARQDPLSTLVGDKLQPAAPLFESRLTAPVGPTRVLPRSEPRLASVLQSDGASTGEPFHVPAFQAVVMRDTMQFDDTIDETVLERLPDLRSAFSSAAGPFDLSWTVPSAVVDLRSMRAELESSREGAQIPRLWYRDSIFIVDVEFERQRLLPDGSWGEDALVEPVPGNFSFRTEITKNPDVGLRDSVWQYLAVSAQQRQIVQPDFLPARRNTFSPGAMLIEDRSGGGAEDPELRRYRREVARRTIERDRLAGDLEDAGGPLEDAERDDRKGGGSAGGRPGGGGNRPGGGGGGTGGGMGGKPPGGGLGGSGGPGRNTGPQDEESRKRRIQLTRLVSEAERRLSAAEERLERKLKELGLDGASKPDTPASVTASDQLVVWAHDIGVKPGETYRYRAVLRPYNPFFTNGGVLVDSQKTLGDPFALKTAEAEWSKPFSVSPSVSFFVVDAAPGEGRLGLGTATIDIYRYYDGQRRRERVNVQPGESISSGRGRDGGGADSGFFLVDVIPDPAAERAANDRRTPALVIVQSATGARYEVRVPRQESASPMRVAFDDEIDLARTEEEAAKARPPAAGGS